MMFGKSYCARLHIHFLRRAFSLLASLFLIWPFSAFASPLVPFSITTSEPVTVTGSPRLALDVGGLSRYAVYSSGSGTSTLTFTYAVQAGDIDLDGISVTSPSLDLNGGSITDLSGNALSSLAFSAPNTSGIKIDYPSLAFDFINNDYILNGTHYASLNSLLSAAGGTFSRGSTGTYFDSAGILQTAANGAARFDFDPITHTARGLLLEETRTNSLKYSSQLDNAVWSHGASITVIPDTTDTTAPDGTYTADKITTTASAAVIFAQLNAVVSATSATYSVYVKQGATATNSFCLRNQTTSTNLVCGTLNFSTDVFTYSVGSSGVTVKDMPNGWKRLIMTATSGISSGDSMVTYIGYTGATYAAGLYLYAWGAQLESAAFPTSYIPTTSATATRSADTLSIPVGSWFSPSSGVLYQEASLSDLSNGHALSAFSAGATYGGGNGYLARSNSASQFATGGWCCATLLTSAHTADTNFKLAGAYAGTTSIVAANNSSATTTNNDFTGVGTTQLLLGRVRTSDEWQIIGAGHFSKFRYYPSLPNTTQIQLLTQ